ncbi:methyltransferase [Flavihumibacter petaseus]|uniref:Putative O-methyltransferase n=1 Tax=Flavihumibacter petaseus NBRC 106054 TaxID=1220578 RepID=A0A0E9N2X9_9BACT|nr:methyltransferase [Flavihumibacter petaseus]GAO44016.1 putative O-methyltransferase [Flavihumibacter petaseus NBRC 106054]
MDNQTPPSPDKIMQIGSGFWPAKILLTAVEFELFTHLAREGKMPAKAIRALLSLKCTDRHLYDFLDALHVLGFLQRDGFWDAAQYSNSPDAEAFLDKQKPTYMGGILEMFNNRLYGFWHKLGEGLKTGLAQNEVAGGEDPLFVTLYKDPERLQGFVSAMTGIQIGNFMALAEKFDFSPYKTFLDAGGSAGVLSIMVAKHNPDMTCTTLDMQQVEDIAVKTIDKFGAANKVKAVSGDFFSEPLPKADVIAMGNILHDWNEENKLLLLRKAYDALPEGGAFIAIEAVIDNDRKQNLFGLMMSLNMLIETADGFDYTFADFDKWAKQTGFKKTALLPLTGPSSAAIAYK